MEPLLIILVPGVFGGLVLALLIAVNRQGTPPTFVPRRLEAPSPSLINMSNIKVEGVGGLGMVAAVIAVAVADPRIGLATIMAAVLGSGLALVLIAIRRRASARASNGPDDRSTLHIRSDFDGTVPGSRRLASDSSGPRDYRLIADAGARRCFVACSYE